MNLKIAIINARRLITYLCVLMLPSGSRRLYVQLMIKDLCLVLLT